ncbi:DUF805 domain-containing protein [Belliella aquatica]|uniref:DUF805 domain-containing protein n=1 Tax=Belliella aquatica TaxID=1323734 RepID=A0ABQ1M7L2_9BACT|nr:DUF805 domain-containing protein [Belliella aquatica]MCH7405571.1 DUF805 domain-containing protein [Belliella aquatica]GGC36051.1 hypothetical protein GCM10010993_13620 [Belliella aquatica]
MKSKYNFFKPTGRITRRKYWILFLVFYWTNIIALVKMYEAYMLSDFISFAAFGIVLVTTIILLLIQAIKRFHDIGLDWKYALYLLIPPPINFIGFIWLGLKKGQEKANEYGESPLKTDVI